MNDPASFQRQLGYQFKDRALLSRALTHRSYGRDNNERLEYLGDSILGFVIAEALFLRFPGAAEGDLTRMRARLVRKQTLAACARELAMDRILHLGGAALKGGDGSQDAILADAFEAVVGAIYLDSDLATLKVVLLGLFAERLDQISPLEEKDPKSRLQEHLQQRGHPLPVYAVVAQTGKDHALTFTVACHAGALPEPVLADGPSRRSAEQSAAGKALALLETHP